jgi:hypothetical protein
VRLRATRPKHTAVDGPPAHPHGQRVAPTAAALLALQRTAGNRAVSGLLTPPAKPATTKPAAEPVVQRVVKTKDGKTYATKKDTPRDYWNNMWFRELVKQQVPGWR